MEKLFEYGKVIFSYPCKEQVDDMVEMMNCASIASMLFTRERKFTREMELDWIEANQDGYNFSVYDCDSLEYVGNCGFNDIENNRGEIGLTICEKMQGKHYAKDIIKGLMKYAFDELKLDEVYGIIFSDNIRSLNCTKQLGFKEYNRDEHIFERNGIPVDDVYLSYKRIYE